MDTTTELTAVNAMLATVGEAPINSLNDLGVIDAITARSTLHEVTREICVEGWDFNTDENYPLIPEGFAPFHVKTPPNALSVVPNDSTITVRAERLYKKSDFSFNFQGTDEVLCQVIWGLSFEELPEVTRQYVAIRAGRRFQNRAVASELIYTLTADDERKAMWAHKRANTRIRRKKYLLDSQSVRNIHNTR